MMIMNMADKIFEVENIKVAELEEYMNDLAEEGRFLYNIFPLQSRGEPWLTVISYISYNWEAAEARDTQKWAAELQAEKESAKHWAAKLAEKSGGHSNE
tara:strand:- start:36 stop:332 length:297 start_codon:yes stop_codon:yes gene_type:complete